MNQITIMHYHLLPGGVTNVILLGAAALIRHFPDLQLLRIVCGQEENTDVIRSKIEKEIDSTGLIGDSMKFEIEIEPELAYRSFDDGFQDCSPVLLAGKLLKKYGGSFWWIHNYQLGKNALLTAAVMHISSHHPEQKMLLHIHDFPECARYDNIERLNKAGVYNPYPEGEGTAYCLINGRDTSILKNAGISEERIYLLNNPVEDEGYEQNKIPPKKAAALKQALYRRFRRNFPGADPEAPILFYPVRTIRRKNALEAGLMAAVSEQPVNLIISLPGVSEREKAYSDTCESCFRKGLIPGIWGSGTDTSPEVPSYPQMLRLCDIIVSSSVQEGFGYLFINSIQLGVPLLARDLDILDGIRTVFPKEHTDFYSKFIVPINKAETGTVRSAYSRKLDSLSSRISDGAIEEIRGRTETFGAGGKIDFSFLPVELQVKTLERAAGSSAFSQEIQNLNTKLMQSLYRQLKNGRYENTSGIEEFSLKTHSGTVEKIISRLYEQPGKAYPEPAGFPDTKDCGSVQQRLLDSFAEPEYMRLLYDY